MTILRKYWPLVAILLGIFLFRIPSFFEPHWYGDEGIYLAIGQTMQKGAVLYRDIWDNKPPLLYLFYAISPTLLWAKISATIFVLGTVFVTYKITKNYWTTLIVGILLSLPVFEGTIANAELYFTLPIAIAAYLFLKEKVNPFVIGFLFTLAFLIKVPAVFDFLGLFLAYTVIQLHTKVKLTEIFKKYLLFLLPLLVSLALLAIYFHLNNGFGDFITAVFKQNFSYVAIDSGPLSKLSNPLFVKAFLLLFFLLFETLLFAKKMVPKELFILLTWFGFSLYGALLSNRPYLHYLLQIIPPGIILIHYLIKNLKKHFIFFILLIFVFYFLFSMFKGAFALDVRSYYTNFFDYISERKTGEQYANYFDRRAVTNYQIGNYIKENSLVNDPLFVWGDNAFVYVLSERSPATKFIQAHHLTTIPPINYDLIILRLIKYQPKFIVVSRPVNFQFPKLEAFLKKNYRWIQTFQDIYVYQNISPVTPPKFDLHYN